MILKLSKIKIYPELSQETNCFSALLEIDGQEFANITNSGTGGSNNYLYFGNHWQSSQILLEFSRSFPWEYNFDYIDQLIDFMLQGWTHQKSPSDAVFLCTAIAPTGDRQGTYQYPFIYSNIEQIKAKAIELIPVCSQETHVFLKGAKETLTVTARIITKSDGVFIESALSGNLAKFQF